MSDEPEIEPIHFEQFKVVVADYFPARTALTEEFLKQQRRHYHFTVDGDVVTFTLANGTATYRLRRDLPRHGGAIVADLVSGDDSAGLKRRSRKFRDAENLPDEPPIFGNVG